MTMPHALPRVTIAVPCRNEEAYIGLCLESILASEYPQDRLEVFVADGRSQDGTRRIVERYAARHPAIRLLDNPDGITPTALNAAIRAATGTVVVRMDAHVVYPPDYLPRLVAALEETGADNVGGVIVTLPADETPTAHAIAIGLSHPLGVGNSYFRIGVGRRRWVETVPFGCYRQEVFQRIGLFDEELVRNQDDEFNYRLIRAGGRILLLPEVVSYYYARGSFRQLARMLYQYGYFKPLVARKLRRIMTVRQLVPGLFVLAVLGTGLLSLAWAPAAIGFAAVVSSYAATVLVGSFRVARRHGARCGLAFAAVLPVMHWSYGIGFWRGVWAHLLAPQRRSLRAEMPLSRA